MDGEVQPKFGLMVSLILMNLTAIALFFFAIPTTNAPNEIPKKQVNQEDNVPMVQTGMVMAGDAENKIAVDDENVTAKAMRDAKMEVSEEGVVLLKKTSMAGIKSPRLSLSEVQTLNPRYSLVEVQTLPGKVEMRVLDSSSKTPQKTCRPAEPPLATALKKFVGDTSSGVRIFFEGLKNGYTIKRLRESKASSTVIEKSEGTEGVVRNTRPSLRETINSNILEERKKRKMSSTEGVVGNTRTSLRESITSNINLKMSNAMEGVVGITRTSAQGSEVNPPSNQKLEKLSHDASPAQNLPDPTPIWEPWEDGSSLSHETIPAEIVMDVLSRTQKRTNELIYVFSKKVVPAIERMNDKVAEAIRLEKNLDSYTSALINAINSVVCPNTDTEMNVKPKHSKPGAGAVKKLRHTKPFCSDLSLIRDSRIHDYVGTFSKGEFSSLSKRPVFKTLAARCWHTRHKRITNKAIKKHSKRSDELTSPERSGVEFQKSDKEQSGLKHDTSEGVFELTDHFFETKDDQESNETPIDIPRNSGVCQGFSNLKGYPLKRTIGIEEVLALTSCLEQSSAQGLQSDGDLLPFLSPLNINSSTSVSSGMVMRSCVIEPAELVKIGVNRRENDPTNLQLNSEQAESPLSTVSQNSGLLEDSAEQARQQEDALGGDLSIVCGSHIQGYDSTVQKEISTVATNSSENEETQLSGPSPTSTPDGMAQRESNHSISLSGDVKNTIELVNVFQQLNRQQKEEAMENVCLLVLRIFEAWTDSQRSISSLGLSRISVSSWPSTDQLSSQSSRPRTAIFRSRRDSRQEQKVIVGNSLLKDDTSKANEPSEPTPSRATLYLGQESAEITRNLLQNVVEAAEVQIAERSLMGLKTNLLRNPPLKGDFLRGNMNSADVNQSGFGDIKDTIIVDEELAASLMSKSRESFKVSKESSAATFYTGQPESSEDAFYECVSTMSAGTCGSLELEVEGSSTLYLERIQEEETRVHKNEGHDVEKPAAIIEPQAAQSAFSIESWLTDSGEELHTAKDALSSVDFPVSDSSSFDISCGTDEEIPSSSLDLSGDESKAKKDKQGQSKKKKWAGAAKLFRKLLKKKSKPSSFPSVALSKNTSRSQSDSVLKPNDQSLLETDGHPTQ